MRVAAQSVALPHTPAQTAGRHRPAQQAGARRTQRASAQRRSSAQPRRNGGLPFGNSFRHHAESAPSPHQALGLVPHPLLSGPSLTQILQRITPSSTLLAQGIWDRWLSLHAKSISEAVVQDKCQGAMKTLCRPLISIGKQAGTPAAAHSLSAGQIDDARLVLVMLSQPQSTAKAAPHRAAAHAKAATMMIITITTMKQLMLPTRTSCRTFMRSPKNSSHGRAGQSSQESMHE